MTVGITFCYTAHKAARPSAGRTGWRLALTLLFVQKGVIMMTDFEMLSVMFMIVMLVFTVLSYKQSK